jgi:hypothetical protein
MFSGNNTSGSHSIVRWVIKARLMVRSAHVLRNESEQDQC